METGGAGHRGCGAPCAWPGPGVSCATPPLLHVVTALFARTLLQDVANAVAGRFHEPLCCSPQTPLPPHLPALTPSSCSSVFDKAAPPHACPAACRLPQMFEVPLKLSSLNHGDCFLLEDVGARLLWVWRGRGAWAHCWGCAARAAGRRRGGVAKRLGLWMHGAVEAAAQYAIGQIHATYLALCRVDWHPIGGTRPPPAARTHRAALPHAPTSTGRPERCASALLLRIAPSTAHPPTAGSNIREKARALEAAAVFKEGTSMKVGGRRLRHG